MAFQGIRFRRVVHRRLLVRRIVSVQVPRIVQVEFVVRRHGQNFAVVRIHDNAGGHLAAHRIVKFLNALFDRILNVHVDRGDDGVAVRRRLDHPFQVGVVVQIAVLSAGGADQLVVVVLLDPAAALGAVAQRKAEQAAGERVVRIGALVGVLEPDTVHAVRISLFLVLVVDVGLLVFELHLLVVGKLLRIADVLGVRFVLDQLRQLGAVVPENLRQQIDGRLQVIFLLRVDLRRIDDQIVDLAAGGEKRAVPVDDVSPSVGYLPRIVALLRKNLLVVRLGVHPLDPVELID